MLQKIGVTGGIGSGKSYVCQIFESMGYPVFYSDIEAKKLINHNPHVKSQIISLLGEESYQNDKYNPKYVSSIVFSDQVKLKQLNEIVHPAVRKAFDDWCLDQNSDVVFNEAALLFENGSWVTFDKVILVFADLDTRIERLIKRDDSTKEQILARINSQWSDEEKKKLSDLQIDNSKNTMLLPQIAKILKKIKAT